MTLKQHLFATISAAGLACLVGGAALAQTAADATDGDVAEVVVTGSRVVTNGYAAPTPLTVITTQALLAQTPSNIPDALNTLPQFAQSARSGQAGPGSAGGV